MKKVLSSSLGCLAILAFTNLATAQIIPVGNSSFEDPAITLENSFAGSGTYIVTSIGNAPFSSIPDWTIAGGVSTGIQKLSPLFGTPGTSQGTQDAWLNVNQSSGSGIITYSGTGADALPNVVAGENYTLTVAVGGSTGNGGGGSDTLTLIAGSHAFSTTVDETGISAGTFTDVSVFLSAATISADGLVGQPLGIQLMGSAYGADAFDQPNLDNVRLAQAAVPEPSTYAMMLAGLAVLGFFIRRSGAPLKV